MQPLGIFQQPKAIVGMIHVRALPGTPRNDTPVSAIIESAAAEARLWTEAGVDGLLIENMHDVPYLAMEVGPEIVAGMTAVGVAVRQASSLPLGVQILAGANRAALAVAQACGGSFIRVENFAYAHVADEGLMPTAEAGDLLRYRRHVGAEQIKIIADVKKKHSSHAITADVSLEEAARTTEFFGADGLVVTGSATGQPTNVADVQAVRAATSATVCIGSGLTPENLGALWPHADVFIVGSYVKQNGLWSNPLERARVEAFMDGVTKLRQQD